MPDSLIMLTTSVVASFLQGLDEDKRHALLHVDYVKE